MAKTANILKWASPTTQSARRMRYAPLWTQVGTLPSPHKRCAFARRLLAIGAISNLITCNTNKKQVIKLQTASRTGTHSYMLIVIIMCLSLLLIGCNYLKNPVDKSQNESSITSSDHDYSDDISLSTIDISESDKVTIKDLHNGNFIEIFDTTKIDEIIEFLLTVSGNNRTSSKGWYGGVYEVLIYNGDD